MSNSTDYVKEYLQKYPVMKYILPGIELNTTEISDKCFILRQAMWTLAQILDHDEAKSGVLNANSFVNAGNIINNPSVGVTREDLMLLESFMNQLKLKYNTIPAVKDKIHNSLKNDNSVIYANASLNVPNTFDQLLIALQDGNNELSNGKVIALTALMGANNSILDLNSRKQYADILVNNAKAFVSNQRDVNTIQNMINHINTLKNIIRSSAADYRALNTIINELLATGAQAFNEARARALPLSQQSAYLNNATIDNANQILSEALHSQSKVQKAMDATKNLQDAILNQGLRSSTNMLTTIDMNKLLEYDLLYDCVKLANGKVYTMSSNAANSYIGAMKSLNAPSDHTLHFDDNGNLILKKDGKDVDKYDEINRLVKNGAYCKAFGSGSKSTPKEENVCTEMVYACLGPDRNNEEKCKAMFKKFEDPSKKLKGWGGLEKNRVAFGSYNILKGLGFLPKINKNKSAHVYVEDDGSLVYLDKDIDSNLYKSPNDDSLKENVKKSQIAYIKLLMDKTKDLLPKPALSAPQAGKQRYIPMPKIVNPIPPIQLGNVGLGGIRLGGIGLGGIGFSHTGGEPQLDNKLSVIVKLREQLENVGNVLRKDKVEYITTKINNYSTCYTNFLELVNELNLITELKNKLTANLILSDDDINNFKSEKETLEKEINRKAGKLGDVSESLKKLVDVVQYRINN
jgi:hypothetical protein